MIGAMPAYFDPRDRLARDVCTYAPKPWYEPYVSLVRLDSVLLSNVQLTRGDCISKADLRRLSADGRVDWVFRSHVERIQELKEGAWVLSDVGAKGKRVGRIIGVRYPRGDDEGEEILFSIYMEDDEVLRVGAVEAGELRDAFDDSGFALTVGWRSATPGVRQLRRLDQKLKRRAVRSNPRRDRWIARQESGGDGSDGDSERDYGGTTEESSSDG